MCFPVEVHRANGELVCLAFASRHLAPPSEDGSKPTITLLAVTRATNEARVLRREEHFFRGDATFLQELRF